MNWLTERIIEVGFPTQDQGKTVYGIIAVIHEHFDVIKDAGAQILCFIDGKEQGMTFFLIQVIDLFLDSLEHAGLSTFVGYTKDGTELFVEICNTDGGQTDVFHGMY